MTKMEPNDPRLPQEHKDRSSRHILFAETYRIMGLYRLAVREYRRAVKESPQNSRIRLQLADTLLESDRLREAAVEYLRTIEAALGHIAGSLDKPPA